MASPIRRVPVEILCEIFLTTVQRSRKDVGSNMFLNAPYKGPMLTPLRISQVCRQWREVATSCSSLWTDINLVVNGEGDEGRDERLVEAVDNWIRRSGDNALTLMAVFITGEIPIENLNTAAYILNRILGEQARWKDVSLAFIEGVPTRLPPINLIDIPLLEEFSIFWHEATINLQQVQLCISYSSSLTSLKIVGLPPIKTEQLSNLRELYLHGPAFRVSHSTLTGMLQNMPGLESLEICLSLGTLDQSDDEYPSITLDKLHRLAIDRTEVSTFIVTKLVLPALKSLTCHSFSNEHYRGVINMLVRSQPSVEYLEISDTLVNDPVLEPLFEILQHMETLCIKNSRIMPSFLDMLFIGNALLDLNELDEGQSVLWPKLMNIHLKYNSWGYSSIACVKALCNMVHNRCISLGVGGVIKGQAAEFDRSGNHVVSQFNIPAAEIHYPLSRKTRTSLQTATEMDILFGHQFAGPLTNED